MKSNEKKKPMLSNESADENEESSDNYHIIPGYWYIGVFIGENEKCEYSLTTKIDNKYS